MPTVSRSRAGPRRGALGDVLRFTPAAVALAGLVWAALGLPTAFLIQVTGMYAVAGVVILATFPGGGAARGLGGANRITLLRLILFLPAAGLICHPSALGTMARWWVVGLGTLAMTLDGVDGWVARRTNSSTEYGARFDMETDAALLMVLSLLVWLSGQAPIWVLGIGALRYVFVAAGWFVPALQGALPPSSRRKTVCVVQGVALLVAIGPVTSSRVATATAAAALGFLTVSFAMDTAWLLRHAKGDATEDVRATPA